MEGEAGAPVIVVSSPGRKSPAGPAFTESPPLALSGTNGATDSSTRPAPGNHDYRIPRAAGYFDYFGARAGHRSRGSYSYNVDAWHLIGLNSECAHIGGGKGSRQERWLRADLAAHPSRCTLAYWHKPRFCSGMHGNDSAYVAFWQALYRAGADVVLVGHDHDYERFAPQTPTAGPTRPEGSASSWSAPAARPTTASGGSELTARSATATPSGSCDWPLHPSSYDWRFVPESG